MDPEPERDPIERAAEDGEGEQPDGARDPGERVLVRRADAGGSAR